MKIIIAYIISNGLEIRDFKCFNLTLLTTRAWRIITNPRPLWVKSLKGTYFQPVPSYELKKCLRSSWVSYGTLEGRELLFNCSLELRLSHLPL